MIASMSSGTGLDIPGVNKKLNEEIMKMNVKSTAFLAVSCLALSACNQSQEEVMASYYPPVIIESNECPEISTDSLEAVFALTLEDIEENIAMVYEKQGLLAVEADAHSETDSEKKNRIVENIKLINALMEENKQKVKSLQAMLYTSKTNNKALESAIADAEARIESQEFEIGEMKSALAQSRLDIADLNEQLTAFELDNAKLEHDVKTMDEELHTAYIAKGSYKELKERNVAHKEGGILGLGSTKSLANNFDPSQFKEIDIRETRTIPVNAKKVKILTEHPDDSYALKKRDKEIAYLNITDPDKFWKANKFLVMEIK